MNWWSVEGPEWEDAMTKVPSRYSRLARAVIAMFVFGVGMLGGVGVAALSHVAGHYMAGIGRRIAAD
jgi:hypothetical protein